MFPRKRHQMRHLCDLACLLAKQVLVRDFHGSNRHKNLRSGAKLGPTRPFLVGNVGV